MEAILSRLGVPLETIRQFCARWNIVEFALFGSVVREDFRPDSDIDVMVTFGRGGMSPWPWGTIAMKLELEDLFGREVDVVVRETVNNPFLGQTISKDLTVVYAA
jgi:hypothetical protein